MKGMMGLVYYLSWSALESRWVMGAVCFLLFLEIAIRFLSIIKEYISLSRFLFDNIWVRSIGATGFGAAI